MTNTGIFLSILVASLVTIALRALPFILFNKNGKTPKVITRLGKYLPFAIMALLVVYCFKDASFIAYPYCIPELVAAVVVVILHILKRNTLLSISVGTVLYMILVQFVF